VLHLVLESSIDGLGYFVLKYSTGKETGEIIYNYSRLGTKLQISAQDTSGELRVSVVPSRFEVIIMYIAFLFFILWVYQKWFLDTSLSSEIESDGEMHTE